MSEPESIELDGVSYVPRVWLRGHRDALDTCCNQLTAAEAERDAYKHAYKELVHELVDILTRGDNDWEFDGIDERIAKAIRDRLIAYEVIRERDAKRIAALVAAGDALARRLSIHQDFAVYAGQDVAMRENNEALTEWERAREGRA